MAFIAYLFVHLRTAVSLTRKVAWDSELECSFAYNNVLNFKIASPIIGFLCCLCKISTSNKACLD